MGEAYGGAPNYLAQRSACCRRPAPEPLPPALRRMAHFCSADLPAHSPLWPPADDSGGQRLRELHSRLITPPGMICFGRKMAPAAI